MNMTKTEEIELCKERYCAERLLDVKSKPEWLDSMTKDGCWLDLVYDGRTASCAFRHPTRLLQIAKAIYNPESELYGDKAALARLEDGIRFWVEKNIRFTDNWWYNSIGVPSDFADIMLAVGELLSPELERSAFNYLTEKILENEKNAASSTGTNIYTRERIRLAYSLYAKDVARIEDAFDIVSSSIKMVTKEGEESGYKKRIWNSYVKLAHLPDTREGMQVDYSFLQHGPLLLSGSYGKELVGIMASFLSYAKGSSLIKPENVSDFCDMVLEHYRWIVRKNTLDYTVIGRSISRKSVHSCSGNALAIYRALKLLSEIDNLPRINEIKAFYSDVSAGKPPVIGNRYFWKSDYTAHQQDKFLLTVRASSNRTVASEQVNTENLLCDYLGDGVTYIYRDGKEYDSIFPVWDFHKVPGTTTLLKEFSPPMVQHRSVRGSESDSVGGVSDGDYGVSAMQLLRDGLSAKKAWFMFDGEFAALGADIKNSTETGHITTVNQSLLRSDITVCDASGKTEILKDGADQALALNWVHHDKTGYFFPNNTELMLSREPSKAGDWRRTSWNGAYSMPESPDPIEKDVFTLWLEHGAGIGNYEYIVVPEIEACEMEEKTPYSYITVLENSEAVQAVENTRLGIIQAVLWQAGESLKSKSGIEICADKSVLFQLREKDGELTLSAASLSAKAESVNFRVFRTVGAERVSREVSIALPDGEYRGRSVSVKL